MKHTIVAATQNKHKIVEIEAKLKIAEIIKTDGDHEVVGVGMKVRILDVDMNEEAVYEIVGTTEADISVGRISNESPLGRAISLWARSACAVSHRS